MNSQRHVFCRTAIVCGAVLFTGAILQADEARSPSGRKTQLERMPRSTLLLTAPESVEGDFTIAGKAPRVEFAVFPGQWEGARLWSSWGDALFASDGCFYASIGDHGAPHGTSYVYRIDPQPSTVERVVDYNKVIGVSAKDRYTPGKIHGALVEGGDGWIYFFGYRGSVRRTSPGTGFRGDWLLRYNLASGKTENLGIPIPHCSVPVLHLDASSRSLCGLAVPGQTAPRQSDRFFRYGLESETLVYNDGPEPNMSRAMILTGDGRAYYTCDDERTEQGVFVHYDPEDNRIAKTSVRVPGNGTMRAASRPDKDGVAYCLSRDGVVFAFDTNEETARVLGEAFVAGPLYTATCRLDPSGRYLYYLPGAHGRTSEAGTPLVQFDVKTGERKVIAFLNELLRREKNYNPGGTYGIAINEDGSRLFVNFNGASVGSKQPDFGLCAAMVVHIPAGERAAE